MKSKTYFLIILLFAILSQHSEAQSSFLTLTGDKVEVNINRHATEADLMDLKKELMENHQIQVDFTSLAFHKKGRLNGIGMSVKTPNGNSGTCKTTLVTGKQGVYFTVDNTPGATIPFLIGAGKRKELSD